MDAVQQKQLYIQWLNYEVERIQGIILEKNKEYNEINWQLIQVRRELLDKKHELDLTRDKIIELSKKENESFLLELDIKDKQLKELEFNLNNKVKLNEELNNELNIKEKELSKKEKELNNRWQGLLDLQRANEAREDYTKVIKVQIEEEYKEFEISLSNQKNLEKEVELLKNKYEKFIKLQQEEYNLMKEKIQSEKDTIERDKKTLRNEREELNAQWIQIKNSQDFLLKK